MALVIVVIAAASCYFLLNREPEPISIEYGDNGGISANVYIPVENTTGNLQCIFSGKFQTEEDSASGGYIVSDMVEHKFDFQDTTAHKFDFQKKPFQYSYMYTDALETQTHSDGRVTLTQPMDLVTHGVAVGNVLVKAEFLLDPSSGKLSVVSSSAVYTPFPDPEPEWRSKTEDRKSVV